MCVSMHMYVALWIKHDRQEEERSRPPKAVGRPLHTNRV